LTHVERTRETLITVAPGTIQEQEILNLHASILRHGFVTTSLPAQVIPICGEIV
jgi:hypothetical protein